MSENAKTALLNGSATIKTKMQFYTGEVIDLTLTEDNYIFSWNYEDFRYVPNNGFIGQFVARELNGKLKNVDNNFDITNRQFDLQLGVSFMVGITPTVEWSNLGRFIVLEPEDNDIADNTTFDARDLTQLFNQPFSNVTVTYPCTALQLAQDICTEIGVTLGTTDFANNDFVIADNQFVNGESCRDVMKAISMLAYSWVRIGWDNKVYLDFSVETTPSETIDNELYYNLSLTKTQYGAINKVTIGLSQVTGETVSVQDDDDIALHGVHEIILYDNPLTYTQALRETAITLGENLFGLQYFPCSMTTLGHPWLQGNELIEIESMDTTTFNTYAFDRTIVYNGHIRTILKSEAMTDIESTYSFIPEITAKLRRTEISVDKANQSIILVTEQSDQNSTRITETIQDLDGFKIETNETLTGISSETASLALTTDALNLQFKKTGNNVLLNTMLYDFDNWGITVQKSYIESNFPPSEPFDGLYWYCTLSQDMYINGKMYYYDVDKWIVSSKTRDELNSPTSYIQNVNFIENEDSRLNYLSQKKAQFVLEGIQGGEFASRASLSSKNYSVNQNEEKITVSFKIKNMLDYGKFKVSTYLLKDELNGVEDFAGRVIYIDKQVYGVDDYNSLGLVQVEIPVQNQDTLMYGITGETAPTDTTKYWLTSTYRVFEYNGMYWEQANEQKGFYDEVNEVIYAHFNDSDGIAVYAPTSFTLAEYITKNLFLLIESEIAIINRVSDIEPEPEKGMYWGSETTDLIKRAKYIGDTFDSWVTLDVSMTEAYDNGIEYYTSDFIFPKGIVEMGDIKVEYGEYTNWSSNEKEIWGTNFYMGNNGFQIKKGNNTMFIDEDDIKATDENGLVFSIDGDKIYNKKLETLQTDTDGLVSKTINTSMGKLNIRYWRD